MTLLTKQPGTDTTPATDIVPSTMPARSESRWLRVWLPLGVLLIAAVLRLWRFGELPPGIYRDEALNGLDAFYALSGHFPLFFREREPIFLYFQAGLTALFGPSILTLYYAGMATGMLTIATIYQLGRRLANGDRRVGILAMALISTSYWHLNLSRMGFRAISLPLVEGLACWALLRMVAVFDSDAPRQQKWRAVVLAGVLSSLTLYTYLAGRLFPVAMALFWVWWLLRRIKTVSFRTLLTQSAIYWLTALLVVVPLLLWVSQNERALDGRPAEVSIFSPDIEPQLLSQEPASSVQEAQIRLIVDQVLKGTGLFFVQGDMNQRHNLAGMPMFGPLVAPFFVIGVLICLARLRLSDRRADAAGLALLTITVMLIPTIFSTEAPHYLRAIGVLPFSYTLPALALVVLYERIRAYLPKRSATQWRKLAVGLAALWVTALTLIVVRDYFVIMPTMAASYIAHEADVTQAFKYLNSHSAELEQSAPTLLGLNFYRHPLLDYAWKNKTPVQFFFPKNGLLLPHEAGIQVGDQLIRSSSTMTRSQTYVIGYTSPETLTELHRLFPQAQPSNQVDDPNGDPYFTALVIPAGTVPQPAQVDHPLDITAGNLLHLLGYSIESGATSPGTLRLRLLWQVIGQPQTQNPDARIVPYVHLLNLESKADGPLAAAHWEDETMPPLEWHSGDLFYSWAALPVPSDLTTGKYLLNLGVFTDPGLTRLPLQDAAGKALGSEVLLSPVKVRGKPLAVPQIDHPLEAQIGPQIRMQGYTLQGDLHPGGNLDLQVLWEASGTPPGDYTIFVHLLDANGNLRAQRDQQPLDGRYPTGFWEAGEKVGDTYLLTLPPDLPPGSYRIELGMYDATTGKRLPVQIQGKPSAGDAITIAPVTITSK